uniref:uncharacterized protein isoform X2 n=1 Tax=Pristiophorus japonicus TaxID=55135 RepID=UPI00398F826E
MNPKQVKKQRKASRSSLVTSLSSIKEEALMDLEPGFESLEQTAQMVHDSEGLRLEPGNTKNRKSNRCKRSRNAKQICNKKGDPYESAVNPPTEETTEGKRESSSKKKHKKSKKNKEKYKNKDKCVSKGEVEKPGKFCSWGQRWAPRPLPVSIASAKAKRKKCLLRDCSSVSVSDENLTGVQGEEQWEEDRSVQAVNNLRANSKMIQQYLCLSTSQEGPCSPANGTAMQQGEEAGADWEEASCKGKATQDTPRKGRSADGLHFGNLNPFRQSSANTCTPTASLDESFHRYLRSLKPTHSRRTGVPGKKQLTCEELCFKNSKAAHVMKASPEFSGDYGNSQDLFITQKTFLPLTQSHSGSGSSADETTGKDFDHRLRSADTGRWRFGSPPLGEKADLCHPGLQSPKDRPCEKGTQTTDFFSAPAMATSLRFCQTVKWEPCSEEPVDLSLPSRVRAKATARSKDRPNSLRLREGSVNPSPQHPPTPRSPREAPNAYQLLPLPAYAEGKKQVKGQLKPKDPRMPLVKKKRKKQKN